VLHAFDSLVAEIDPGVRLLGVWIVENRGFLQKLAIGKRFRGKQQLG
jgi:hypothetical protein